MGFWDFLTTPEGNAARANASMDMDKAAESKLALQNLLAQQSARAKLVGGPDPLSADPSINWSPQPGPTGSAQMQDANGDWKQYSLLGDTPIVKRADTMNLLTADPNAPPTQATPDSTAPPQRTPSDIEALQKAFLQQDPNAYTSQRSQWLAQADPEAALKNQSALAARQASSAAINALDVPANVKQSMLVEAMGTPETAKALSENIKQPEQLKTVNAALAGMAHAQPGTPEYDGFKSIYTQATQNIPAATLAETIRQHTIDAVRNNFDFKNDAMGNIVALDKRTGQPLNGVAPPQAGPGGDLHGDEWLSANPDPKYAALVKARAEGAADMPNARSPGFLKAQEDVLAYDPQANVQTLAARKNFRKNEMDPNGKTSQSINALNTASGHLGALVDDVGGLGNKTGFIGRTIENPVGNAISSASGHDNVTNFVQNRNAVASELRKVYSGMGGGNLQELEEWQNSFGQNGSPEQLYGGLNKGVDLMMSKAQAIADQRNAALGTHITAEDVLSPSAKAAIQKARDAYAKLQQQQSGTASEPLAIGKTTTIGGAAITRVK